jgi:PAS domain S-box-containing protein
VGPLLKSLTEMQLTHSLQTPEPGSERLILLLRWSKYFAIFILAVGLLALAGWTWNIDFFKRPIPHLTAMNPMTALNFLFAAISFLLLSGDRPLYGKGRMIGKILAGLVLIVGLLRLAGPLPGLQRSVDQLFFAHRLQADQPGNPPNQMTIQTAFCFVLSGLALFLLNRKTKGGHIPAQYIALLTAMIALFSLIGYLYRVQAFYGPFSYIPMSVNTSACFLLLSLAVLLASPGMGLMKELTGTNTGSAVGRSMLPFVILLPVLLGYLRLLAYWIGLITTEFGVAVLVSSIILTFCIIIWFITRLLNKRDRQKQAAEEQLLEGEERFRLIVSSVKDYAIFMLDPYGRIVSWNEGAERIKGYKKEEIIGRNMSVFYTPDEIRRGEPHYNLLQAKKFGRFEQEGERVRKNGSVFWANVVFTALRDPNGNLLGFTKVTRDITERKRSEEQVTYLARLMEDTSDAIFSTDTSFIIRSWNKAAELLYGFSLAEVRGQSAGKILRTQMNKEMIGIIREKMIRTNYWKGEVYYLTKAGNLLTILLSASGVKNAEGQPDGFVMVCRDFTERKKMELQLQHFNRELEEQVKKKTAELIRIFERITDAFIAVDKNLCYTYLNKKAGELIHRDPASMIGKYVWDIFPDAVGSETWHAFNKALTEQRYIVNTDYYPPLDLWQENHLYPSPDGLSIFIRDITEKKRNEKEITDYKYALDQSSIVSITDEKGVIKYVNDNFCRISGYTTAELTGQHHRIIGSKHHQPEFFRKMWQTISNGEVWKGEIRNLAKDGATYWVDMTIIPFLDAKSEPYEYIALDSDITERKKAEELLDQSYQDIRQLASHLQDVREEERAGIAREIHDELGQQLTGIKMDLSWISKRKATLEDNELHQKTIAIMSLLDTTIKTVRKIATDLRPSILDDLGLVAAIEWQSQEFERRSGICTKFISSIEEFHHSSAIAIGLFRICQESLTNIARHAAASQIRISLQEEENEYILLRVEDNGKGFEFRKIGDKKTLGLLGMKERTLMMGGEFRIESEPGKGTTLFVTVPITIA